MTQSNRLEASCRMALAALLHDLGKFAERAGIDVGKETRESHLQIYCPRREAGGRVWYTHQHAAYTAMAFDLIEPHMPRMTGGDVAPFAAWNSADVDDSMINAGAKHHTPATFLQWVVATADRAASGFEREEFDRYNHEEGEAPPKNHYQTRLLTLFEQIHPEGRPAAQNLEHRYPLAPLAPETLFPGPRQEEPTDDGKAKAQYRALWDGFVASLKQIPESHRSSLSLWLDHFDTLWQTYTHAIPSATAFGVKPEVPLYDHSKAVAAMAVAIWCYHHDRGDDAARAAADMRLRKDWDTQKFLLVQGDFFGIQKFLFQVGSDSNRKAAKLLRGRSFYVSLVTECAALAVLDALDLPSTSQILNAAGKFLIVAPNTEESVQRLAALQGTFDAWFLEHSYGEAGLGLAWQPASCNDFLRGKDHEPSRFRALMAELHGKLERAKYRHFDLCGGTAPPPVFAGYLDRFNNAWGACSINERAPAEVEEGRDKLSRLAADQIRAGDLLVKRERLILSTRPMEWNPGNSLRLPIFGYHVHFTGDEDETGKFGAEVAKGNIRRFFDFSLPKSGIQALWNGYARRNIRAYVPVFDESEWEDPRYDRAGQVLRGDEDDFAAGDLKTLHHLACEDEGVAALHTLKGDIDDLGAMFQHGLEKPTFAKMAALSRQVNNFFAVYLPWLCRTRFPESYTVFAGGDDFFLIGPWHSQLNLARAMREEFRRYVAGNPDIHFSAGLSMTKPALPIRHLAEAAEDGLASAKYIPGKNAVTVFGQVVTWAGLEELWDFSARLGEMALRYQLSTAYIYGLLSLADMRQQMDSDPTKARWRSYLAYRTWRMVKGDRGQNRDEQQHLHQQLVSLISAGIQKYGAAYKIALQIHLYQQRD